MSEGWTDETLALAIQQGQVEALRLLVERHYHLLKGYLYRMSNGNMGLCEDMTQETFIRLLQGIHTYQYPRPFKPWLYAIATNLIRKHFGRADTRYTEGLEEEHWQTLPAAEATLEDQLIVNDDLRTVVALVNTLTIAQREVLFLRYYQGLSLAEIAEALQIPEGTVKSRLSLTLKRLREAMREV